MLASNISVRKHYKVDIICQSYQLILYFVTTSIRIFEVENIVIYRLILIILYFFVNTIKKFVPSPSIIYWAVCQSNLLSY